MKRTAAALTALLLAVSLAGCQDHDTAQETFAPAETTEETAQENTTRETTEMTKQTSSKTTKHISTQTTEQTSTSTAKQTSAEKTEAAAQPETEPERKSEPETKPFTKAEKRSVEKRLADMSLHEKVCQMFITNPEAFTGSLVLSCDGLMCNNYDNYPIGGFIFFGQNINNSEQTKTMLSGLQEYAKSKGTGVFMSVDEEGGRITRLCIPLNEPAVYDMQYYGENGDIDGAFAVGDTIGTYLSEYGFNVDFAPVADVNIDPNNELGSRIFSSDPNVVAEMTAQVVKGLDKHSVCSTLKHFPGLGAGNANTHYGTVTIDRSWEELSNVEFIAFKGGIGAGADFVMVGHQIVSAAGDGLPSDLSHTVVTDWLKGELGFKGLVITDSQAMGAIANVYGSADAAVMSVEAGVDIVLMPYDLSDAVRGVEEAVESGRISEERINESVLKILKKKDELGLLS